MKIYGVFDPNRSPNELKTLLEKMNSQLDHEKYWKSGNFITENFGIGHVYSEIVVHDIQPVWNENHTKFIVMVGKIFDYEKMKKELVEKGHIFTCANSDAEFVLHGIEEWGERLLRDLNGFFVLVIYDTIEKSISVANDRCAAKPFYYYMQNSTLVFASEIKAIIKDNKVKKEINWDGWRDFFSYGFVLGNKTLFKNVYSLPPAAVLKIKGISNGCNVSLKQYWNYSEIQVDHANSEQYFIEKGTELLKEAILRQTKHLKKCIVLLSGGYDSRFIASAIRYYTDVRFETFTTRMIAVATSLKSTLPTFLDPILAKEIAKILKVKNTYFPKIYDIYSRYLVEKVFLLDGMSLEHLWIMPLVDNLSGQISLDGLAGGVLMTGASLKKKTLTSANNVRNIAIMLHQQMRKLLGSQTEVIIDFFENPFKEKLKPKIDNLLHEIMSIKNEENIITIFHMSNRTKNAIALLPNNIIGKRATCFFPFLDKDLVEFSLTIPPIMKITKKLYARMLAKMFPEIMRIPSTHYLLARDSIRKWLARCKLLPSVLAQFTIETFSFGKEVSQLLNLLESLRLPPFVNLSRIKKRTQQHLERGKNPLPFLTPISHFCIWYSIFYSA